MNYSILRNRNVVLAFLFALLFAGFAFAQDNSSSAGAASGTLANTSSISADNNSSSTTTGMSTVTGTNGSGSSSIDESSILLEADSTVGNSEDQVAVRETGSVGRSIWIFIRMILVLAFVVFLIWLVFKYIKKANPTLGEKDKYLRKVAGISVGPGKTVQIITLLDKAYIIGVSDDSINLIAEVEDKELIGAMNLDADINEGTSKPMNFQDLLNSVIPTKKNSEGSRQASESAYSGSSQIIDMIGKQSKRLK